MRTWMRTRRQFLRDSLALTAAAIAPRTIGATDPPRTTVANELAELPLPDGRRLAYAEFGDPNGSRVILHHHGMPSCRLEILIYQDVVANYPGLRILAMDRPGIGGSTPDPNASIQGWPADLTAFADALKVDRFAIVAPSAGAPYGLAVARAMPKRVASVTLVGPLMPKEWISRRDGTGAKELTMVTKHPTLCTRFIDRQVKSSETRPNGTLITRLTTPTAKKELLKDPRFGETYRKIKSETFRQGASEVVNAILQLGAPWSQWLSEVSTPVTVMHGTEDTTIPAEFATTLATHLPNAEVKLFEGESHLSLPARRADAILDEALRSR